MCQTKEEGGVGLRSLQVLREVAMYKLAWKLLDGKSLRAQWTRNRYLRDTNFWVQKIDNNFSVTVKNILRVRPSLKEHIRRVIHDGKSTSLWLDPWLENRSIVDRLGGRRLS